MADTAQEFCRGILEAGDLATKLSPPPRAAWRDGSAQARAPSALDRRPARCPELAMTGGAPRLPRPRELADPGARARCLARFAHHELMAVELFAWALLRWPDAPERLRRGLLAALADEQIHCRLYLDRLRAHEADISDFAHSDYFWRHVPAIAASSHGLRAFLCGVGLTLEQANLDFTLTYRDAFRAAGDEESAVVCQRVHDDEIRHVRLAAAGLEELAPQSSQLEAYSEAVPFPLSASRAKGRQFHAEPRVRAGLSDALIEAVRRARSSQESGRAPHSAPARNA